jgi:hypothetical protein
MFVTTGGLGGCRRPLQDDSPTNCGEEDQMSEVRPDTDAEQESDDVIEDLQVSEKQGDDVQGGLNPQPLPPGHNIPTTSIYP